LIKRKKQGRSPERSDFLGKIFKHLIMLRL